MMPEEKKCDWFDKLKEFDQIIILTDKVKKQLNLKDCKARIGLYNKKTNTLMYENE